jgi:hypothetical protein
MDRTVCGGCMNWIIVCAPRTNEQLMAGGSAPAPWVTFSCLFKRKSPKRKTPGRFAAHTSRGSLRASLQPGARKLAGRTLRATGSNTCSRITPASLRCSACSDGGFKKPVWRTRAPQGFGRAPRRGRRQGCLRLTRATWMSRRGSAGTQGRGGEGVFASSGACFLWFLSLHEKRKKPARGAGNRN